MKATDPIFREKVLKLEGTVIKFSSFISLCGINLNVSKFDKISSVLLIIDKESLIKLFIITD